VPNHVELGYNVSAPLYQTFPKFQIVRLENVGSAHGPAD
jgi:hypothetical protein